MKIKTMTVIAWQTFRSYAKDRIFHSTLIFSILFMLFSFFLSTLTFTESKKILLDFGLSAISMTGIVLALFLGCTLVGKEIEKRTIYTILSKPVSRTEYLLGKFLGGSMVILIIHLLTLATLTLVLVSDGDPIPHGYLACNFLMVLESLLILVISLFLSLYTTSLLLAASLAVAFFLIGRSNIGLRMVAEKSKSEAAHKLLKVFYDIFPALDRFNIRELVAYSKPFPKEMLLTGGLYFVAYLGLFLCLSVLVFRKKDLT